MRPGLSASEVGLIRGAGRKDRKTGTFGSVDKLATGYRARYYGPDGCRYRAPVLFQTKAAARAWLSLRHSEIVRNAWLPPQAQRDAGQLTLAVYADQWLARRDLKDRTREHYRKLLDRHIIPALGSAPIASITADDVRTWYATLSRDTPTQRAHTYSLLRTILGTAVTDDKLAANPCVIRGGGSAKRAVTIRPASLDELAKLVDAMPERYRAMVLLASWCALRFGEVAELRRADVDVEGGLIRVRRAVVHTGGGYHVTTPKSRVGVRDVAVPPHLLPVLREHFVEHVEPGPDALLFPAERGGHLARSTLHRHYAAARTAAGRPDLRFHDLRHTGAVLAASTGATLAELMARLGHSTAQAALRYQHVAQGRDQAIAEALSRIALGGS